LEEVFKNLGMNLGSGVEGGRKKEYWSCHHVMWRIALHDWFSMV